MRPDREDVLAADARQPVEPDGEDVLEDQAEEEDRDRDPEQRRDQARVVEQRPVLLRGEEPERDAEADREHHRGQRELDRRREPVLDLERDWPEGLDAGAEVEVAYRLDEVAPVLDVERLVEPELKPELGDGPRRRPLTEQCLRGRSREQADPDEDEERDPEQDRDEQEQSADDEAKHLVVRRLHSPYSCYFP